MKLIIDIRYYPSKIDNYGYDTYLGSPYSIDGKAASTVLMRFVLKLREIGFCLPDFNHIYVSLSPSLEENEIQKLDNNDPYHKFHRDFCVGVSPGYFNSLSENEKQALLIEKAVAVIQRYYCESDEEKAKISHCAKVILENGVNERIIFKEKKAEHCSVQIIVSVLDFNTFKASTRIMRGDEVVKEIEYPETLNQFELPFQFGSITIGKKAVTIKPKKNSFSPLYDFGELKYDLSE